MNDQYIGKQEYNERNTMKPSIYNEYEAMTQEAMDFFLEIETALRPIFERGQEQFNVRDVEAMIVGAAAAEASIIVLKNAIAKRKAEKPSCPDCNHPWIKHRQTILAQPFSHRCEHFTEEEIICGCNTVKPNA
jgi:hypothetical protein